MLDLTLARSQNDDPRDFEKRPRSTLLTGPRRLFCSNADQEGAERVVFDTLTFRGVQAGEALAKRNWDDSAHPEPHEIHMVYSDEHDGLVHGRHAPHLVHKVHPMRTASLFCPIYTRTRTKTRLIWVVANSSTKCVASVANSQCLLVSVAAAAVVRQALVVF